MSQGRTSCFPLCACFIRSHPNKCGMTQTGLHIIQQAEGGEQGDPLMPALYSLGQHGALEAVHAQMQPNELLVAFLDDVITIARPDRVGLAHQHLADELWAHCRVRLNSGKTRIWNLSGRVPPALRRPPVGLVPAAGQLKNKGSQCSVSLSGRRPLCVPSFSSPCGA